MKNELAVLTEDVTSFPDPKHALEEPDGLLAIGGDLGPQRLLEAYKRGIFPWYDNEPILWWSPSTRTILKLADLHISRSMQKILKTKSFQITMDAQFPQVIASCASLREQDPGTWITPAMMAAYTQLHQLGYAHSLEVIQDEDLVGGIYGVSLGKLFFAESMFSRVSNASKIAIIYLVKQLTSWGFDFIDCQLWSTHLGSLGAKTLSRADFLAKVAQNNSLPTKVGKWTFELSL